MKHTPLSLSLRQHHIPFLNGTVLLNHILEAPADTTARLTNSLTRDWPLGPDQVVMDEGLSESGRWRSKPPDFCGNINISKFPFVGQEPL